MPHAAACAAPGQRATFRKPCGFAPATAALTAPVWRVAQAVASWARERKGNSGAASLPRRLRIARQVARALLSRALSSRALPLRARPPRGGLLRPGRARSRGLAQRLAQRLSSHTLAQRLLSRYAGRVAQCAAHARPAARLPT